MSLLANPRPSGPPGEDERAGLTGLDTAATEAAAALDASQLDGDTAEAAVAPLHVRQMLLYSSGGIAGGVVFTMMNNALPLFLLGYTMPLGLPAFLNPGGAMPATVMALLTNERSFFGGLIQPIVGQLSDRTRSRLGKRSPYVLVGGIGTALAIASLGLHPPFWLMIAAIALAGILLYVALGPYSALLADITPYSQRGRVGGLMSLAAVIGAVCFTVLGQFFWDTARGWVFAGSAIIVAVSLAVVAFGVHEPSSLLVPTSAAEKHPTPIWKEVLGRRTLALYTLSMAVYWLGAGAATPFITRFAVAELHIKESETFSLLLIIIVATVIGTVLAGLLADRYGRKRVLQPALVLFAVAALIGSQVQTLALALPVMLLVGLSNAVPTALNLPLLADLVPKARAGACMGFSSMLWSVAQPIGSLFAGILVDVTQSYRGIFVFAGVCMALSALMLRLVHIEQRRAEEGAESQ